MSNPHVLVLPGQAVLSTALAALGPYTKRSSTVNFDVYYDNSLGTNGQNLADAVLAKCEQDLAQLRAWFGGINAGRFAVYIDPGFFGAYHATCLATEIHCAAFSGTNGDLVNMVNVAEVDEVLMAVQNAGWDCGGSNGEGLSRVLATERYPAQLNGFATAPLWLDGTDANGHIHPDYVNVTDAAAGLQGGDLNHVGCATLFINFLRFQLGFSLSQIVQAAGSTLSQTYKSLTGRSDGWNKFSSLIGTYFPQGTASGLTTDNPFPIDTPPWGYMTDIPRVVYRSAEGHIHELSVANTWHHQDLTDLTSAAPAAGRPMGYVFGVPRVVYRGVDGHIHELFRSTTGVWTHGDLSAQATNGPGVPAAGEPFGYASNVPRVVYRGTDGHIHELFIDPGTGKWKYGDLSGQAVNGPGSPAEGDPMGYVGGGVPRVVYRGTDGHVHELFVTDKWKYGDLSAQVINPPASPAQGQPFGYEGGGVPRVVYRGKDGHIHELFVTDHWKYGDLSGQAVNGPGSPAEGDPMGYVGGGVPRVVYRGTDGHVHELFVTDKWKYGDLSAQVINPPAAPASGGPMGYVGGGVVRVLYRGTDGHVHELFIADHWKYGDLWTQAGRQGHL